MRTAGLIRENIFYFFQFNMIKPIKHIKIPITFTHESLSLKINIATGTRIKEATTFVNTAAIPKFQPERYTSKKPNSIPTMATANPMLAQFNFLSSLEIPFSTGKKKKPNKVIINAMVYVTKSETGKFTLAGVLFATK